MRYLKVEDVSNVIGRATGVRDKALLAVIYNCGLRRGEVALLVRDDFMPRAGPHGALRVRRLKREDFPEQEIPLWGRTSRLLRAYLKARQDSMDALFLSRKSRPMTPQAVYYAFRRALAGTSIRSIGPHCLRHSIATHLINMGLDLVDVQDHLGHKKIDSTLVYAKLLNPRKTRNALLAESSHHVAKF